MSDYSEIESKLDNCCFIPVGYRCFTGKRKAFNLKVRSLPFDNGFFPPQSIASILKSGNMNLFWMIKQNQKILVFVKRLKTVIHFKKFQKVKLRNN